MILRGLVASGKSSFAKQLLQKEPKRWVRINRDDLRSMFHNSNFSHDNEEFVRKAKNNLLIAALKDGYDCILDDTHLVPATVKKLYRLLESIGDIKIIEKCFNISIVEAKRRNALREGKAKVPDSVIDGMSRGAGIDRGRVFEDRETYFAPRDSQKTYETNEALESIILVDLDGTLSLLNGRDPFDASTCDQDLPHIPVIACVKAMYAAGYKIIYMSGRENQYREPTEKFIAQHLPNIPYELHMRNTGDSRKDSIIKEELLEANVFGKFNILFAIDDREQVVSHYRNNLGITVFQCAEGYF